MEVTLVIAGKLHPVALLLLGLLSMMCGPATAGDVPTGSLELVQPAVAYHPRGARPGVERLPSLSQQIREDLRLLRRVGFRSLVTYGAAGFLAKIPELARAQGFDGTVVMGIWDPESEEELAGARAQKEFVDGYAVGNEGLDVRYDTETLGRAMGALREATGRPVTTTEPIDSYLVGPYRTWLLANSDWLFPLAHPFWADILDPRQAAHWILARHDLLVASSGQHIMLKEVGFPTSCSEGCAHEHQMVLFDVVQGAGLLFFHFEAFDQPWKSHLQGVGKAEAHWGLFDAIGQPKPVIQWLSRREW